MLFIDHHLITGNLARSAGRHTSALAALLTTSEGVSSPGPVLAAAVTAENVDVSTAALNGTGNLLNLEAGNGDTGGGLAGRAAVLVILLDDDTVLGDVGQLDVGERDVGDSTGSLVDGLDADTVVRVDDVGVRDGDILHDVVVAQTNGTDGDTVAAGAGTTGEGDVLGDKG